ncbi:acyl-CoA dehydrogenase type 2 domain-containing protein [Streptomyces viridochromogenes DSM 40736]|uniref:Acyl-CoA dehydrogenase type 2 domain-containing protein n=1 Tax=Streptomyces viridochromogenes (strain DSM 40736 / JCM 4977 / BCRC 1201 / Tue 494) TaxID=591159 RepID=D9XG69_STRVT|nr:acyl-CoA dehydrogenase family protein [Streptomyces viridochromogenes]EFL36958.1 acyl-CoA dehydrogenase type 2 domain-containing protein [Streptomyces viridochromogenes DSM 40736]
MGVAIAPADPASASDRTGPDRTHWLRVARETAEDLATDAVAREQAGKAPFDEVSRLRESGLLPLLISPELGGGGADWPTAYAVVRDIATADSAIAQLLGSHYFLSWSAGFLTEPALAAQIERQSALKQWCWGGGVARQDLPLTLATTAAGHVLDGRQSYTTGVLVADRLVVRAVRADTGEPVAVVVDPGRRGVRIDADADPFGQRLAAGGSVEFDGAPIAADDVLGSLSADEDVLAPLTALASPVGRLLSVQLRLGMAEGVLAEARDYSRAGHSPWHPDWPVGSPQDPQVLTAYGELTVLTRSASALTDQAQQAVHGGLVRGEDITYEEYAEISVLVAMAEAAASKAAQECTARALDIIGARSASARLGFDRFWRNARTHTLYEPVTHRLRDVGDYFLNGAHPPFSLPV